MKKASLVLIGLAMVLGGCKQAPPRIQQTTEAQQQTDTSFSTVMFEASSDDTTTVGGTPVSSVIIWKSINKESDSNIAIARDTETGCEYIELDNTTVTPRLNEAGLPKCGR